MSSSVRLPAAVKPQLDFWRRQLEGMAAPIELPADRLRPSGPLLRRAEEHLRLPEGLLDALELVAQRHGVDLPLTLLAGFLALLHRYTGREDLVVGSPVTAGASLLPLRVNAGGDPTFSELLGRTSEAVRAASAHQELTLEELAADLEPEPDPSRHPLFQVAFLPGANLNGDGLDLELGLAHCETGPALAASYSSDLFEAATVRRLLGHLLNLLEGVAGEVDSIRVSALPLLGPEEREQVL
ncbi:MAG TPA: condensation domain-containing protein, partial [Solirubrobacterales bacterium]